MRQTLFILALLSAPFGAAVADQQVDRTLDAHASARINVSNLAGSIDIEGWDKNQVQVTGTLGDDVDELIFERDGREILIKVKAPDGGWGRRDVDADLTIRVPVGSSLEIGTVSADIEVKGVRGEQELHSVSGDVTTQALATDVQAESVSGNVEVTGSKGVKGVWDLSTVSGDVTATSLSGEIDIEAVSGDIEVLNGAFERADIETVSGDIVFNAGLIGAGRLDVETVNGNVDIEFIGGVSARFDIETFNGRIRNCFGPEPERASKYAPGLELSFTEGAGDGRVSVATLNGDLKLCKK